MNEALAKVREANLARGKPFTGADDPRRWKGPPPEVVEVRRLARATAAEAFEKLVGLMRNASGAVQVQAAKAVLGIAGVSLQPSQTVKHQHELPAAPPSISLRELLALVRGQPLPVEEGPAGAMPRLGAGAGNAAAGPSGTPRAGAVDAQYREIIEENPESRRTTQGLEGGSSGPEPDVLEAGKGA